MSASTDARSSIIYECPECETRYLDERRCPDCQLFTRRIGPGGTCPHCDEPVAQARHRPVYVLGEWAAPYDPAVLGLAVGDAEMLNDDRVGLTLDRLLHHAHICQTSGESVRLSQALAGDGVTPLGGTR